ncbi:MAG: phosphatidylglycerophosphatase A, partial [Acidobacteriales bacterium]|nr:phosphatidylglycerophosphatase A [Terriglobales bacterium]
AVLLYCGVAYVIPEYARLVAAALALAATAVGIPAATIVARESRIKDPGFVVIDEVAGQALTLMAAPFSWKTAAAGFILFRLFDILKPPPVRQLEALREGTGIVVDDLGAGLYGALVLWLLHHYRVL